jgi:hypothetical protein
MRKPRIFIASSVESLDVADAININLDRQAEVTIWRNGTFKLSTSSIDSLVQKAKSVDFAIFIFTPDDLSLIRDQSKYVVRDNVLFELGLFIGTLEKNRCFLVKPRDVDLHFPTDLLGLTPVDYEANRSDGDLASAVNHPCILIKKELASLGVLSQVESTNITKKVLAAYNYKMGDIEHQLLAKVLESYTESPNGVPVWTAFNNITNQSKGRLSLAAIKLERIGYIEKGMDVDQDHEFYTFIITADGIDYMLENEHLYDDAPPLSTKEPEYIGALDDSVPF